MIVRTNKKIHHYTIIDNRGLQDDRLSWGARGLLAWILTHPDSWEMHMEYMVARSPGTLHQLRKLLKELKKYGYAELVRERRPDGTVSGSHWVIYEDPKDNSDRDAGLAETGEKPESGESAPLLNTNVVVVNNNSNKKNNNITTVSNSTPAYLHAFHALTDRGVEHSVAYKLLGTYGEDAIMKQVEAFDKLDYAATPGWLVSAVQSNYQHAVEKPKPKPQGPNPLEELL